jgi:hypothetical protein
MLDFTRHIVSMPVPWRLWIAVLFSTNMTAVVFLPRAEAVVVLAALLVGALLQMALYARFGFVRLLGAGRLHWLPLVAWLWSRLATIRGEGLYHTWAVAVIAVCGLSLTIDIVDVVRYVSGERGPTIRLQA